MSMRVGLCASMTVEYHPSRDSEYGSKIPASVWITLDNEHSGGSTVFFDIEHVRQLAEQLPGLVMAHDAAEHAVREQAAPIAEAA
ncbi:hypothetical protein [Nocardia sp. NBC_01009]|uniref:hypothetical protein n=1 Tax=Nocardia sp. NBC_01009 TaxID=2975996 RepID=UPI0038666848|nr:hypothetical protein OHA42_06270 [Nocardia sp. NBC_01009]